MSYTGDELDAGICVIVVEAAPGDGPSLHRHPYEEVFVVQEGEATFTLGDEQRVVRGGEVVVAPPGVAHRSSTRATARSGRSTST